MMTLDPMDKAFICAVLINCAVIAVKINRPFVSRLALLIACPCSYLLIRWAQEWKR